MAAIVFPITSKLYEITISQHSQQGSEELESNQEALTTLAAVAPNTLNNVLNSDCCTFCYTLSYRTTLTAEGFEIASISCPSEPPPIST